MVRRDAFSGLREPTSLSNEAGEQHPAEPTLTERHDTRQPLDLIPTAQPRKKRSRNWERTHRAETVTYRGVPREYHNGLRTFPTVFLFPEMKLYALSWSTA